MFETLFIFNEVKETIRLLCMACEDRGYNHYIIIHRSDTSPHLFLQIPGSIS